MKNLQPRAKTCDNDSGPQSAPMLKESNPLVALGMTCTAVLAALSGCATSQVAVVGRVRPAISPEQVQIYLQPPDSKYDEIANLSASSRWSHSMTAEGKIDKVIERLKRDAAKLGANGILLHGVGDQAGGSIGAGISTETNSPHSPNGLGFGASAFFFQKSGDGVAIYVEPK
jgi:hypothetical protein